MSDPQHTGENLIDADYVKNLEALCTARTEQLRQAANRIDEVGRRLKTLSEQLPETHDLGMQLKALSEKLYSPERSQIRYPFGKPGDPVPEVDPEDIKAVWCVYQECQKKHAGEQFGIDVEALRGICNPGANMGAVSHRHGQLCLLMLLAEHKIIPQDIANTFISGSGFTDAAFRAIAKVPMEWMEAGVIREGPPYHFEQFLRLCAA